MIAFAEQCPTILTIIPPAERARLDAAAAGSFFAVHAETVSEAVRRVRERPVNAVLLAPGSVPAHALREVAHLAEGLGVPTVALVSPSEPIGAERLLAFGASGVRRLVDLSAKDGWRRLRELLAHPTTPIAARILTRLIPALGEPTPACRMLFRWLVTAAPTTTTVRALIRPLGLVPSTFMSRFQRARLPSPKRYLAHTRLLHAAALLERPSLSVTDVAYRLEFSSPQSFGRHVRALTGFTATAFRRAHTLDDALAAYCAQLIDPFRPAFRIFRPFLTTEVGAFGQADPGVRAAWD